MAVKIRAPAKINLTLRVIGRRADGYHLLDTIMVPVSLYDEIDIQQRSITRGAAPLVPIEIRCSHPQVPLGRDNIAYRAAELLMQKQKVKRHVCIRIQKKIPIGAGLGGGSTDAAAVLIGLNRMWKLRLSVRQMERLALQLGADVFRFDASDLMPGAVGAGTFWTEVTAWVVGGSTDDFLNNVEASWPK